MFILIPLLQLSCLQSAVLRIPSCPWYITAPSLTLPYLSPYLLNIICLFLSAEEESGSRGEKHVCWREGCWCIILFVPSFSLSVSPSLPSLWAPVPELLHSNHQWAESFTHWLAKPHTHTFSLSFLLVSNFLLSHCKDCSHSSISLPVLSSLL